VGMERQTNVHTNIQTHTHTFRKTISGNQAHAHSRPTRAPGLIINYVVGSMIHFLEDIDSGHESCGDIMSHHDHKAIIGHLIMEITSRGVPQKVRISLLS